MKKSFLFIGLLILIIAASLISIPSITRANTLYPPQEVEGNKGSKMETTYCCPKCDYCSTKAGMCPTHNSELAKKRVCYGDSCKLKSGNVCTCKKCAHKRKMECEQKAKLKKESIKK